MNVVKNDPKTIRAWAFFDWANSAYALVISTAVFPPYFSNVAPEFMDFFGLAIESESMYSFSISLSFLLVAIMTPILSGIADYSGRRMYFMKLFTLIGALACMALFFFDSGDRAMLALGCFVLGTIGFGGSVVFYNSYLPVITTEDKLDRVSAKGFAYGYIGSVILLVIILLLIQFGNKIGIQSASLPARIGFVLVGLWWIGFALITFKVLPKDQRKPFSNSLIAKGYREVRDVAKLVLKNRNILLFLTAYFFYIAGVNVVIYLASVFAKDELGFGQSNLILLILLLQFLALVGAYLFAYISEKAGNKLALLIQVGIWVVICFAAYFVNATVPFYILSLFVGLVFGGIQSLSRSTYTKMMKEDLDSLASYFSFYDVLTKLAVVSGTLVFGVVNQITGSMRLSILSIALFFVAGFVVLLGMKRT